MTTIQDRLQRKREPLDKWSTREQLCLAFAVVRSGDQNWISVSRALKPFGDHTRPSDWFHQKNCAAQYGALLENIDTPRRKKRTSGVDAVQETASESILKKLIAERKEELRKVVAEEKEEFAKLQAEMALLKSGNLTEEQLDLMCKQIDEEDAQKERETAEQMQWLKEREIRKLEHDRQWRPMVKVNCPSPAPIGHKRKASDSVESLMESLEHHEGRVTPTQTPEPSKPALSPLLTSLLKSPSHAQNVVTSSILHSAITSQRPINCNTNPTIASLLNSSASVQVSPGIQQLVSTAIAQEPIQPVVIVNTIINNQLDLLDDTIDTLPNLKVEDMDMLSTEDPLPEIKNEEVDVIISDLIESAEIVTDPEQHLLDGNDLITDLDNELEELVNEEKAAAEAAQLAIKEAIKEIDPFEFQEDPEIFEPTKPTKIPVKPIIEEAIEEIPEIIEEVIENPPEIEKKIEPLPGSVEIVEVVVMEDEEISKELNKSEIQNIVHSTKPELIKQVIIEETAPIIEIVDDQKIVEAEVIESLVVIKKPPELKVELKVELKDIIMEMPPLEPEIIKIESPEKVEEEEEVIDEIEKIEIDDSSNSSEVTDALDVELDAIDAKPIEEIKAETRENTFTPEFGDADLFDDMNIEVTKLDKAGKAKRDYSRTKKKDETEFDMLLAVEQAVNATLEEEIENNSDKNASVLKPKIRIENERSNSPWTEEDEINVRTTRRRYSTPATPIDSIPNSPASSVATVIDDDRDFRNWKKSVLLVYSRLSTHKYASLFHKPITNEQVPGYHDAIKRPMDLQTLRKNIENGVIRTTAEFQRDVLLMFTNAIMFNKTHDTVYKMASEMQEEGVEQIRILLQVQAENAPSTRRETRTSEGPGTKRKRGNDDSSSSSTNNSRIKKRKDD